LTSWKLQAFNEFMEVAFFTQLIANISNSVPGYELDSATREYVLSSLETIQAVCHCRPGDHEVLTLKRAQQEEMHAYNANDAVRHFTNGSHMFPCTYQFPVSTFAEAVDFAQTLTDMYIGLLANIQQRTAEHLGSDSNSIVYVLAQALGQEGQQSGWFRSLRRLPPSAEPFLTTSTREFALSWMQHWIVPGSCPNMEDIPLRILPPLAITAVSVGDASHSGNVTLVAPGAVDPDSQRVAFVNGALVPTVVPFKVRRTTPCSGDGRFAHRMEGGQNVVASTERAVSASMDLEDCIASTEIVADMPYAHNVMHGLVLMAVVESREEFITAQDVTDATVFGPALLEWS
jgi:hypothetical protein